MKTMWEPMPFGKYRGVPLDWIARADKRYLLWLLRTVKLSAELKADIQAALAGEPLPPKSAEQKVDDLFRQGWYSE